MALEDIRNDRLKKLALLREEGIEPYPMTSQRTTTIGELLSRFDSTGADASVTIAGRILAIREHE
jgi:lysyl-tRNA synthetase class 2